ncbi:hypothetical protein [Sinanaerobacter sp. ZZT-01]|uniref:hypothetical protein n=1 Tax=Sinanaerobacter sp. ZZT-01 TaxID=3111540 RepID=UPI002D76AD7B|nr:hypothetical protein [Sinanaerobacter sp. ZZT-01]WRR94200.1 hypothetical protein U5921_03515 [Sinanaerobacter sp. ZZT-01]
MAKRKETLEIEKALNEMCRDKRIYGCEEITIGFVNNGYGDEIVDFMTMDSKGIIRCYEIKVTIQDLKSSAKKSWYGHYNYLVVSDALLNKIGDWEKYKPNHVGLIRAYELRYHGAWQMVTVFNPKRQEIDQETNNILKESIIRSMFYKMLKYKDSSDMDKANALKKEVIRANEERKKAEKQYVELRKNVKRYERAMRKIEGKRVYFEDVVINKMKIAGMELPQEN